MYRRIASWVARNIAIYRAIHQFHIGFDIAPPQIRVAETVASLITSGITVIPDTLDDEQVSAFAEQAEYQFYYPDYYRGRDVILLKKIREHYMAARLLNLQKNDVYLDVASQSSPAPLVYERLFGSRVFRQDLEYPSGKNGRVIGGSAGHLPLPDNSITKIALHCALEHFEGDEDIALIRESARLLTKGGCLVIVPLYLSDQYFVRTQPSLWAHLPREQWPVFPQDALICGSTRSGNRHERYYDARHLIERLIRATSLQLMVHSFGDSEFYAPGQMRFAAVFRKSN